jgi:hypothetical protein
LAKPESIKARKTIAPLRQKLKEQQERLKQLGVGAEGGSPSATCVCRR